MMGRREFLRASSLIAAGVIAADQLEILDRLAPRRLFAGAHLGSNIPVPSTITLAAYGIDDVRPGDYIVYHDSWGMRSRTRVTDVDARGTIITLSAGVGAGDLVVFTR